LDWFALLSLFGWNGVRVLIWISKGKAVTTDDAVTFGLLVGYLALLLTVNDWYPAVEGMIDWVVSIQW